jgi:NhaA family Na+:H+ antiporter
VPRPREPLGPLRRFLAAEAAGGAVLVVAAVVALLWANSPWHESYDELWTTTLTVALGDHALSLDLRGWIDEGLMGIFFLVVGLEIKRELVEGELREPRRAAMPAIAALGGMVVPAVIFTVVNAGHPGSHGWGIPTATDIALAVGVLSLVRPAVPESLKLFLLALAIVDDIGAVILIAVFYSGGVDLPMLALAIGAVAAAALLRVVRLSWTPAFVALGVGGWLALHESGVHATLMGVAFGLLAPTTPRIDPDDVDVGELVDVSTPAAARRTVTLARRSTSTLEWLELRLHPWSTFLVLPLFALANAGIRLDRDLLRAAATSRITYGVVLGLVVGKAVGITAATWLARVTRIGRLPDGTTNGHIVGVGIVAGVGFTVALFVTELAFDDPALAAEGRVGVLVASVLAGAGGALVLRGIGRAAARARPPTALVAGSVGHDGTMTSTPGPPVPEPPEQAGALDDPEIEDPVDEAGEESFPASDPPGWWAGATDPPVTHPGDG